MFLMATDQLPYVVSIDGGVPVEVADEEALASVSKNIIRAMDSIPKGGPEPTIPRNPIVTVTKDGKSVERAIMFADVMMIRGPKQFVIASVLDAIAAEVTGIP